MIGAAEVTGDWGKSVAVAVMDTGISASTAEGMDEGHGTAMASLIGGASRPAQGAAPGAKLLDFPVLGKDGIGDAFSLAEAILKAVDQGARVINMSLGSPGDSAVVREAVAYALSKKVALVAAAGNDSVNRVNYPAAYAGVVAVASVDASRQQLYFSNRGPQVAVAAPGYEVIAAWPGQKYVEVSGTSGSTALVSGAIAALLAKEPGLTGTQAAKLIADYADDVGAPGRDDETGSGMVNLQRVLERNQRGILDVAVAGVTLKEEGSLGRVTAAMQNRGTETVNSPVLEITAGNNRRKFYFGSLMPGQTLSESLSFDLVRARQEGGISAGAAVSVQGDQRSGNDVWTGYFRISK
jgi:subtilisin family serine protease